MKKLGILCEAWTYQNGQRVGVQHGNGTQLPVCPVGCLAKKKLFLLFFFQTQLGHNNNNNYKALLAKSERKRRGVGGRGIEKESFIYLFIYTT